MSRGQMSEYEDAKERSSSPPKYSADEPMMSQRVS